MINYPEFHKAINLSRVAPWHEFLLDAVCQKLKTYTHGELEIWQSLILELPEIKVKSLELNKSVSIEAIRPLSLDQKKQLTQQLKQLHPWRKGPFNLFDIHIDTEWRSDWKWERIQPHIGSLKDKSILDVGCGNGYHCWRMLGEQARFVLGIDPSQKYLTQFSIMQKYINNPKCHFLPLGIEDMPEDMGGDGFDNVFCLGVLYHRKDPINLLYQLKNLLTRGGELILETLVVDGDSSTLLVPSGRYAQMRNVWFLPSIKMLELWLKKCGYTNVRTVDVNQTTTEEQRTTEWMTFHSLKDFLDEQDLNKTNEGYQAPKRATFIATKP